MRNARRRVRAGWRTRQAYQKTRASGTPQFTTTILRMLLMVSGIVLLPASPTLWSKAGGDAVDGGHALDWLFGF